MRNTITASGYFRGHLVFYIDNEWRYSDGTIADGNAACVRCGKLPTKKGYDACLGYLLGVISACCGHGVETPYLVFEEGKMNNLLLKAITDRWNERNG